MKKSYRVKKDREFQQVFHKGKSTANRQFVIYKLNKEAQAHFRVGISVSKKLGNDIKIFTIHKKILSIFPPYQPAKIPIGKLIHSVTIVIRVEIIRDNLLPQINLERTSLPI